MPNITTCTKCGARYEAGSSDQADERRRLCVSCRRPVTCTCGGWNGCGERFGPWEWDLATGLYHTEGCPRYDSAASDLIFAAPGPGSVRPWEHPELPEVISVVPPYLYYTRRLRMFRGDEPCLVGTCGERSTSSGGAS